MPQLLNIVKLDNNSSQNMNEATVDWGTIAIYTCAKSCNSSGNQYKREFAWKQPLTAWISCVVASFAGSIICAPLLGKIHKALCVIFTILVSFSRDNALFA